jgi:hypothetical protein
MGTWKGFRRLRGRKVNSGGYRFNPPAPLTALSLTGFSKGEFAAHTIISESSI